jgi:transposase
MRQATEIELTQVEKQQLTKYSKSQTEPFRLVQRSRIILLADEGKSNLEIAAELKLSDQCVAKWRNRFVSVTTTAPESLERIYKIAKDDERTGRPCTVSNIYGDKIIKKTISEVPQDGTTHWSCRTMAKVMNVSPSTVGKIWRAHQLRPHLIKNFKLSNDPMFYDKLKDVISIITAPPENSVVYSVDEKSGIQALNRTQRAFLMKGGDFVKERKGHNCTRTHDYQKNGTTTLLAGFELSTGRVVGFCDDHHTHIEWIKLLHLIEKAAPKNVSIHLVLDNYATHKHPKVIEWLNKHPRFFLHFIPTSSSWCNPIERWFRELTEKAIKRGNFHNKKALIDTIMKFMYHHNLNSKSYTWNAKFEVILGKIARAWAALAMQAIAMAEAEGASQEMIEEASALTRKAEKAKVEAERAMEELNEAGEEAMLIAEAEDSANISLGINNALILV